MKNQFIIPSIIIAAAILGGFWMLKLLSKATEISIHQAAIEGNIEKVKQHWADGTDVNIKDKDGITALHFADGVGNYEIVELLLAKGADVNAKTKNGVTPLDIAIDFKQAETADLLSKHGGKTGEELKAEGK